jgi:hypothetical protein
VVEGEVAVEAGEAVEDENDLIIPLMMGFQYLSKEASQCDWLSRSGVTVT